MTVSVFQLSINLIRETVRHTIIAKPVTSSLLTGILCSFQLINVCCPDFSKLPPAMLFHLTLILNIYFEINSIHLKCKRLLMPWFTSCVAICCLCALDAQLLWLQGVNAATSQIDVFNRSVSKWFKSRHKDMTGGFSSKVMLTFMCCTYQLHNTVKVYIV